MMDRLTIAHSSCPNDTFVFHAWSHGLIRGAPELDVTIADIDVTNGLAEQGTVDVLKVSYAALPYILGTYALLPCGGSLGHGCGPLLLIRPQGDGALPGADWLAGKTVAVPSERSTAHLLLRLWRPGPSPGAWAGWSCCHSPRSCPQSGMARSMPG